MSVTPLHQQAIAGKHMNLDPTLPPLTVQESAPILNVSPDLIYDAIERGEIKALRLGRAIRIPRAEIARLLGVDT